MNPCPYCGQSPKKVFGLTLYPHRPDLAEKKFWQCAPCDAYVGCHPNQDWVPLGRLANAELRAAKVRAHAALDPLWKSGRMTRGMAYQWLAQKLKIEKSQCHIGMFDVETCNRVVEVCDERYKKFA